jgi:anti-sigma-K factor RskA
MTVPLPPEYLEDLLAGYVLGNLSPEEAEDLQRILLDRPDLIAEAQILQEVLAVLPYALPVMEPSPQLRQNILDALTVNNSLDHSLDKALDHDLSQSISNQSNNQSNLRTRINRPVWGISIPWRKVIGGLAALVAVAIAIDNYRLRQQLITMQRQINSQRDLLAMLQQPNTRLVSLKGMDQAVTASGNIVMTPGESQAVLILQNLTPLPDGQAYQLWSIVNNQKIPWEQFRVDQKGTVFVKLSLPENQAVTRLAITVELSPPPLEPTGPMVMTSDL